MRVVSKVWFSKTVEIYPGFHVTELDGTPIRRVLGLDRECPRMHLDGRDLVLSTGDRFPLESGIVERYQCP